MTRIPRSAVVLGARTTGRAITARLLADGWRVTAVARSEESLGPVRAFGARAVTADAADPGELAGVLDEARHEQDGLDLVVNAIAPSRPAGPFGGGPIAGADLSTLRGWGVGVLEQTFVFLHAGARALRPSGGTLVQLTGGSSLHVRPGTGAWAAGAFGSRALVHAAANELSPEGIHVALLIVDGVIGPPAGAPPGGGGIPELEIELDEIASAVAFLAIPGGLRRAHELHLSRAGTAWRPG